MSSFPVPQKGAKEGAGQVGVVTRPQKQPGWDLRVSAALPSPNPRALICPHSRRPLQLCHHDPTHFLAGGSPSPPPFFSLLRRDTEAQHSSVHGRYGVAGRGRERLTRGWEAASAPGPRP